MGARAVFGCGYDRAPVQRKPGGREEGKREGRPSAYATGLKSLWYALGFPFTAELDVHAAQFHRHEPDPEETKRQTERCRELSSCPGRFFELGLRSSAPDRFSGRGFRSARGRAFSPTATLAE
jgi:hypothetical protein